MPWYTDGTARCENGSKVPAQGSGETRDQAIHSAEQHANQQCYIMGSSFYEWDGDPRTWQETDPPPPPPPHQIVGPRWLDGGSDGTTVGLVDGRSHGTRWKIEQAPEGIVYLRSWNQNFQS